MRGRWRIRDAGGRSGSAIHRKWTLERRRILLDCDPGHGDAIANMLAIADPTIELIAVTTVAGNVTLANTTNNALRVLDLLGRGDIPVAAGRDRLRVRDLSTAAVMHGESGLAGPLPVTPSRGPSQLTALQMIEQVARRSFRA